jgi:pimeloyl-ACP methyl ester carboxylesterase
MRPAPAVLLVTLLCVVAEAQESKDEYVGLAGNRLHLKVYVPTMVSLSAPTLVLESGGGFDARQWDALQPQLAEEFAAVVVAYDRPGFGASDLPDHPYDINREVSNLHQALETLNLGESIVIVAHSYGALLAQLYASSWPQAVSGLVFLDPNSAATMAALHEIQTRPFKEGTPQTPREKAFARIDAAIWDSLTAVYRSPLPTQIPLTVVSAEQSFFPEERLSEAFRITHRLLALSVTDGRLVVAERSNHMIPAQRPDAVVEAVRDVLTRRGVAPNVTAR